MEAAISIRGLKKTLTNKHKNDPFTIDIPELDIPKGYITGFIGRNGAGKTTTIKLILDMLRPDEGEVLLLGKRLEDYQVELKELIGLVGDMSGYMETCKVRQIHDITAPFYQRWDEIFYQELMTRYNLPQDRKLTQLSQGQRKLFSLIMTLSHRPKLLILDEPTANLDPVVRADLLDLLGEMMMDEEMTIFYSTHITSDLENAGDYIVAIDQGRIQFTAEKDALEERFCMVKGDNRLLIPETTGLFVGISRQATGFRGLCSDRDAAIAAFGQEALYEKPTIEEIMVFMARRELE